MTDFFNQVKKLTPKERKAFKKRILIATGASNPTWYSWINQRIISNANKKLISTELNQPVETLFP